VVWGSTKAVGSWDFALDSSGVAYSASQTGGKGTPQRTLSHADFSQMTPTAFS